MDKIAKKYLIPCDSQNSVKDNVKDHVNQCLNLSLLMARYIPRDIMEETSERNKWLRVTAMRFEKSKVKSLLDRSYKRWEEYTTDASQRFTMRTGGRLIVGLGYKGALEIGITLQFITGLPVISGSALKGAARSYGLWSIAAQLKPAVEPQELDTLDEELGKGVFDRLNGNDELLQLARLFHRAFGSQDDAGICVFHDSVVCDIERKSLFEVDVMTPHFPKYYDDVNKISAGEKAASRAKTGSRDQKQKLSPPGDDDSPRPLPFLTVAPETTFAFAVGLRHSVKKTSENEETLNQAARWLKSALEEFGVGSKTAAGYGWFKDYRPL